ncbi:RHS repeat-associated core domain-containing protein [Pseudomonas putida]|uniref:RHS repeat-associated core domain-containing protein n=1 Tax=Pseudomonas putida TaxID=303 RepID=UPI0032FEEFC0|nr:hypothetical protein [Pseudomonas putida]
MRFSSPDRLSPFDIGGINTYSYCSGDPINFRDPSGLTKLRVTSTVFGEISRTPVKLKQYNTRDSPLQIFFDQEKIGQKPPSIWILTGERLLIIFSRNFQHTTQNSVRTDWKTLKSRTHQKQAGISP